MEQTNNQSQTLYPMKQEMTVPPGMGAPVAPNVPGIAGMAEGGLLQEGGSVDPVSGNEVPAGSLKEEVRDDIPAKLSEGEFVFPADVVRFIGLERLMQLRQEAKEGLRKMEAMGQMGNADEATMDDNGDFETEIDDIISEVEAEASGVKMAEGGMPPERTSEEVIDEVRTRHMNEFISNKINLYKAGQISLNELSKFIPGVNTYDLASMFGGTDSNPLRNKSGDIYNLPYKEDKKPDIDIENVESLDSLAAADEYASLQRKKGVQQLDKTEDAMERRRKESRDKQQYFAEGGMPAPTMPEMPPEQAPAPPTPDQQMQQAMPQPAQAMRPSQIIQQALAKDGTTPEDKKEFETIVTDVANDRAFMMQQNNTVFVGARVSPGKIGLITYTADDPDMYQDAVTKFIRTAMDAKIQQIDPAISSPDVITALNAAGAEGMLSAA
jgi:hypothetical protein